MPISQLSAIERVARVLAGEHLSINAEGYEKSAGDEVNAEWLLYIDQALAVLVAPTLLEQAVEAAKRQPATALYLSCWTENERAMRFYTRHDFVIVGRHDFPVGQRIDEDYILRRTL